MPSLSHHTQRLIRSLLAVLALAITSLAQTTLTANTGINPSDTYVLFDLSISSSTTVTTSSPIYNASTGTSSTTVPLTWTATYHVQAGYDSSGALVTEMWPTGTQQDPTQADVSDVSMIRLAGGQIYVFDRGGNLLPLTAPNSNVSFPVPLQYLGENPAASVLVGIALTNVQNFASSRGATAYAQPADCAGPCSSNTYLVSAPIATGSGGTVGYYYAASGSNYVLYRVKFAPNEPNESVSVIFNLSNVIWSDNATADQNRANQANTSSSPPAETTGSPSGSGSQPSGSTESYNFGGSQGLVLQHGLWSSPSTWDRMYPWLADDFRLGTVLIPQLQWADHLTDQATQLQSDIPSYGLPAATILIGHSQGGLISRSAAQYFSGKNTPMKGVITLDSPQQGAPLAVTGVSAAAAGVGELASALFDDLGCTPQTINQPFCFVASLAGYTDGFWLTWGGLYSAIPALQDLVPGSSYLQSLNAQTENFTQVGIASEPDIRWMPMRLAGDFLCTPDQPCGGRNAAVLTEFLYDYVQILYVEAWASGDFPDADYYMTIMNDMNNIDLFWYVLVGGPSDGIVPNSSQSYPYSSATQYIIANGDSHLGNTRSDRSRTFLDSALREQFQVPTQASCTFGIVANPASVGTSSGSGSLSVTADSGCGYSITSDQPWLTLSAGQGNSGESISFSYAANSTTAPRDATITVSNGVSSATITIHQAGDCTYSLGYSTAYEPDSGDSSGHWDSVTTSNDECVWTAQPQASWLSTTNQTGTGSAGFYLLAAPNSNSANLAGTVNVMGQTLTVYEGGTGGTSSSGSLTISGYEASTQSGCPYHCYTVYESENIYVTIGGVTVSAGASKYGNSTSSAVAQALANAINGAGAGMPVSASVSGSTVALTSKLHGSGTDYSISVSYSWSSPFTTPDFNVSASGMSGGS